MKKPVEYTKEELERPSKYIIVVADPKIDTSIIDIEEAQRYVEKFKRRAIIISAKGVLENSDIEKLNYLYIRNATVPNVRMIDNVGHSFTKVYETIMEKYQNGLIIAHADTITHQIADQMAQNKGNGLDFIVYRQDLMGMSSNEKTRVNYLRIHNNPEFQFNKSFYRNFAEKYGDGQAIGVFTAQYIANYQYNLSETYFREGSEKYEGQGDDDFIDYYELNRQLAFHVYYDTAKGKILGFPAEKIQYYMELVFKAIEDKPLFNKAKELSHVFAM